MLVFFSKLPECGWAVNQSLYQHLLKRHHQNRMNKPNLKSNKLAALKLYVYICMNRRTEFTFILTTVTKVPKYMPVQDFRATTLYFIEGRLPSRHERRFCLHLAGSISEYFLKGSALLSFTWELGHMICVCWCSQLG